MKQVRSNSSSADALSDFAAYENKVERIRGTRFSSQRNRARGMPPAASSQVTAQSRFASVLPGHLLVARAGLAVPSIAI